MVDFHDARLRETLAHCGPIIEGYEGRLDAASSDIKRLEEYLDGKVDKPVDISLSETHQYLPRDETDGLIANRIEGEVERLVLMKRAGRWRLMYIRSRAFGRLKYGDHFESWPVWNLETPLDRRPLIETPGETRLRAARKLPEFVQAVARLFTIDPREVEPVSEIGYGEVLF
jgi:hypothetical protein